MFVLLLLRDCVDASSTCMEVDYFDHHSSSRKFTIFHKLFEKLNVFRFFFHLCECCLLLAYFRLSSGKGVIIFDHSSQTKLR
jgi:hypothetical protein